MGVERGPVNEEIGHQEWSAGEHWMPNLGHIQVNGLCVYKLGCLRCGGLSVIIKGIKNDLKKEVGLR